MRRILTGLVSLAAVLGGCTTGAPTAESTDRAACKLYARGFQDHRGRMKDACLISKGYEVVYDTVAGWVEVQSKAQPRQAAEVVATDLKGCNDATTGLGYEGRAQFAKCMDQRGYAVRAR